MRYFKPIFKITTLAGLLAAAHVSAQAQCAMCKAAVANSTESAGLASSMNLAVLVLLAPPVVLFCAFIVVLYRFRKAPDEYAAHKGAHAKQQDEGEGSAGARLRADGLTHA